MADRSAKIWAVVLAAAVAAAGPAVRAADPVPALPAGPPVLPPDPPAIPTTVDPPPSAVTAFQRPPEAQVPDVRPDPFREPPLAPPAEPGQLLPDGSRVNLPAVNRQLIRISPRYGRLNDAKLDPIGDDTNRAVYTGGVIVNIQYLTGEGASARLQDVEFATDNAVIWTRSRKKGPNPLAQLNAGVEGGEATGNEYEFYFQGNVVIRTFEVDSLGRRKVEHIFRAKEMYYEVARNRAVALGGDIEMVVPGLPEPVHMRGREMWQLGPNEWRAFDSSVYSSKRPADPALTLTSEVSNLTRVEGVRRNVFGIPYRDARTGEPVIGYEQILVSERVRLRVFDVPVFWYPRTRTDLNEPLGPLAGFGFAKDNILGFQTYFTWNLYRLLGFRPPDGHRWVLYTDYFSKRGPALGTEYDYRGLDFLGLGQQHSGFVKLYGVRDRGQDLLGGGREDITGNRGDLGEHPEIRGRLQWRHNQDLYENGTTFLRTLVQVEKLSDANFLEQYYKREFDYDVNQESFAYVYGAAGNLGGSLLYQQNLQRQWVTETEWMPRADGHLIGQNVLDLFTYSVRADAGYAGLRPTTVGPPPVQPTDVRDDTGRFHLNQRLSLPFDLGPFRLAPYGVMDVAYYTQDLTGQSNGRFYGGGGAQASLSMSRLYADVTSELFNVKGIYHKITYAANYYVARSDTPYTLLPQLDRLNDDATDYGNRVTRPRQNDLFDANGNLIRGGLVPGPNGQVLATSPIFDPQLYAIRRLVENKVDTLDSIQVLQLFTEHRLQTKRGFPGAEHVVDWMTLDLSASVFPEKTRDNFGKAGAFFEYSYLWHVGDRTSISSAGWYDPFDTGVRYFNFGVNFNRPDGSNFYLGYRHTDPLESRALSAVLNYPISRKYSMSLTSIYDFGLNQAFTQQISFARVGTDTTVLFGVSYNALLNNFGVQFAVVPNLLGVTGTRLTQSPFLGNQR